ncbi:hypothetical protein GCM10007416_21060 [Kroppenstedtia guangzhouensis]|uniref:Uncharacterized protein n=1 Tax=Kroppenstedtia guangzhouensis TaxID=1274356 RepID=A0ABQ1GPD1_9BACL|nr:hypothetical protein GCM10007416_21060 [Kroppenstedtia guangzhouensis]
MVKAVEGAEDSAELGWKDIKKYGVSAADAVVGLAARPYSLCPGSIGSGEKARCGHRLPLLQSKTKN